MQLEGGIGTLARILTMTVSLNLNVHFHVVVLDGVFSRDAKGRAVFHPNASPPRSALENVIRRVHARTIAWLTRPGHVDLVPLEARSNEERARGALERCAAIAMNRGATRRSIPDEGFIPPAG